MRKSSPNSLKDPVRLAAHKRAVETEYRKIVELAAQDDANRQRGIRSLRVISGDPKQPYVALTFDDGPHGERSLQLLEILRREQCPATFFIVGCQIAQYPGIVERIALAGHEVGNHTFNHHRLTEIPITDVPDEINACRDLIYAILGMRTRLFRPPGGDHNPTIQKVIEANGYANILWSDDPADYKPGRTAQQIESLTMRDLTPGGIILLHDGVLPMYAALPRIIARIRAQGLIPVTVSELIERAGGHIPVRDERVSRTSAL